jgi:hypothetical protein
LAGILVGLCALFFLGAYRTAFWTRAQFMKAPVTVLVSALLLALHLDAVPKLWVRDSFWSSRSSQVCLSAAHVIGDREWLRLISAPLEHASHIHFMFW